MDKVDGMDGMKVDGTVEHFAMGFIFGLMSLGLHSMVWPALYVCLTVELVQAEIFGWSWLGRLDTWHDVGMDLLGLGLAWVAWVLVF